MNESVICVGGNQGDNSARHEELHEFARPIARNPLRDSVIFIGSYEQRSNNKKAWKGKENLIPVATVDLTKEPETVHPSTASPEGRVNNQPECPLCFESLFEVDVRVTQCGHLFCKSCLDKVFAINGQKCPKCRKCIRKNLVRPVYM